MGSVIFKKGELVAFLDLNHTDSLKVSTFVVVVSIRALPLKGPLPSGVRFAPCFAPLRALQAANAKIQKYKFFYGMC